MSINQVPAELIPPNLAIQAMRDSGYKNTAFALAELIDNSIQAGAKSVEVLCVEEQLIVNKNAGRRLAKIGVLDNGSGMDGLTLRSALQFGNGTHLEDRSGMGRFGMGLPNSSISQCRRVDIWTWRSGPDNALHTYLDLDEIQSGTTREVPEPRAIEVPHEWHLRWESLSTTGTLIVWSEFERTRLTWKQAKATLVNTEILVGRMYRKFIESNDVEIRLASYIDDELTGNEFARVNDPLYLMKHSSTPPPFDEEPMFQKWGEKDLRYELTYEGQKHTVTVRMSWARPKTVSEAKGPERGATAYGMHAKKNVGVSIVRAGRELDLDSSWANGTDPRERWWGVEIEFPPTLDEVFGVTNNKQAATIFSQLAQYDLESEKNPDETPIEFGERLKDEGDTRYLLLDIAKDIKEQLRQIRNQIALQGEGRRSKKTRHEGPSVEDAATEHFRDRRDKGFKTKTDGESFTEENQENLKKDLKEKGYSDEDADGIIGAVKTRGREVIFVQAEIDSPAFFNVDPKFGVTEIVFNRRHPAYDKLIRTLDEDVSEAHDADLLSRVQNASDTLKLLFAAWARYEEEDLHSRDEIRDMRFDWGRMARKFLADQQ